jgi:hypothetical protein
MYKKLSWPNPDIRYLFGVFLDGLLNTKKRPDSLQATFEPRMSQIINKSDTNRTATFGQS